MASEKIPPCETHFGKMKIGTKWCVVPKLIFDQKFEISFLMLKWVIVRCIGAKTFRFSQNKVVNMKNGPGKNSALERLESVFLATSVHVPRPSELNFLGKMVFFFHENFFGPFWKYFQLSEKISDHLGKSVHIPIDYFWSQIVEKSKISIFWKIFSRFFKKINLQALEKNFFSQILKV